MDAFDDVLRNRRDAVPPQAFYERLVQILARRRDPLPLPRAERELAERQAADAAAAAEGPRLQKDRTPADQTPNHALALTTAAADERLVRLAVDVFRRVHAEHPATALVRPAARLPFVLTRESTWTPLDSARRGGAGVVADREAGDAAGVHARGHRADWARFQALVRAAAGDDADLTQLCETRRAVRTRRRKNPFRAGAGGSGDAESDWDSDWDSDDEDETRRRKRERATAGASSDQRRAERAERRVVRDEAAASEPASSEATRASSRPRRLGAALLFLHACRVFTEDADARLAAFEARVERRLADLRAARRGGGSGGANARARADGAAGDHSPVPDSQSPGGAGAFAFAADASDEDEKGAAGGEKGVFGELNLNWGGSDARAAFAASLPRNALLYRLVADHAPSDAERAVLFRTLLSLAATATADSETDDSETDNSETADNSRAEDVSPRALAAAAHALLARFGALFDAAELAGGDRRLVGYKRQLEEETFRSFRDATGPAALRRRTAHFADARPVAPSHKLSLVRSLLRDAVDNRRKAPGIMRPGLGATRADSAEGGADVLEYVAADARAAVKAQANALGGNVKHAEAVATLGAMLGAAAQFVAWTARREKAAAEAAEGEAAEAEAEAERAEAEAERADGEAARARRNARRRGAMVAAASAYAREAGRETAGAEDDADDEARVAAAAAVDAAEGALMSACA